MIACESVFTMATRMWFVFAHLGRANSIVDAKGKIGPANSRPPILGANIGRRVLAEFSRVFLHGIECVVAIAFVACRGTALSFILCNAFRSMQTNMISARANLQLVLALNSKVTIGTHTMLEKLRVSGIVMF